MKTIFSTVILFALLACNSNQSNETNDTKEVSQTAGLTDSTKLPILTEAEVDLDPQIALKFANDYVKNIGGTEIREWTKASELASKRFKSELVNLVTEAWEQQPEYGLGYDPILAAQDNPNEFEISEFDKETGLVKLNGVKWKQFTLNIKLIIEQGRTVVDGCGEINLPEEQQAVREW